MNEQTIARINDYPNFLECSIQTFNDRDKEDKIQSRILPMTSDNLEKCIELQNKLPYGIFFSVNPMESGKRNKESVKKIQTWICDIDTGDKEKQLELINNAPLKPSLVVESNHGFHLYYIADKDLTEEEFENGNRGLKNYYGGDPKVCKDTARVLRIPGYYHMKGEKYMVSYRQDLSSKENYSMEQITQAFPNQQETTPGREKARETYNKQWNKKDGFWTRANQLNTRSMLEELSGTGWVSGDIITFKRNSNGTEQIYCNGKSTSCRIDNKDTIGSNDKGGPYWTDWLEWYGVVDRKELAKYLKEKHPELEEKKPVEVIETKKFEFDITKIPKLTKPPFTWGNKELDNELGKPNKGQLIILCGETGAGKTTFATFMARKNDKCCYYVLEDKVENIAMRYAMKYANITKEEFNNGELGDKERLFIEGYSKFASRDIDMIDIGHKITVDSLIDNMLKMKEMGKEIFFIDNLGFVIGEGQNEAIQTADASNKLVSFCLEQNVCIVLLHHFKKRGSASDIRDIGQMRGSGKLGDDAFMVVEYLRDSGRTYLRVYKDRTWGDIALYEIGYNRGDFEFLNKEESW